MTDRVRSQPGESVEAVYLLRHEHPQVYLTWGSKLPRSLDRLKLRKVVNFWPLRFILKADYETRTKEFSYGVSCKDSLLNGRVSLNVANQRIEYRKRLPLGRIAALAMAGSFSYAHVPDRQFDPCFGIQLEFGEFNGGDSRAVWAGSTFDLRQKIKIRKGLKFEVCGSMQLPTPAARYSLDSSTLQLGDGSLRLHLAEVNAILKF